MVIVTVGIDLAKNVFAVHGVYATGKPVLVRPAVACGKLAETIAALAMKLKAHRPPQKSINLAIWISALMLVRR
jgi:hypothetical protein